jgi:hypothetical protein
MEPSSSGLPGATLDGKYIFEGTAANPFQNENSRITTAAELQDGVSAGDAGRVQRSQCPHCKDDANELREDASKTYSTQVRVEATRFPTATGPHQLPWPRGACSGKVSTGLQRFVRMEISAA